MNLKPTANSQQPTANSQQPTANSQQPKTEHLHSQVIVLALAYIEKNLGNDNLSDDLIAHEAGTSTAMLIAQFEAFLGVSPWEYVGNLRLERAKSLLETTSKSIYEIAPDVGMDPKYFSDFFKTKMGVSPTTYRKSLRVI